MQKSLEERFWKKVRESEINSYNDTPCLEWIGGLNNYGYGCFSINGKIEKSHRVSWIFENGDIPIGLFVLHHCDNPCCVNPDHLFLGTQKDNVDDMIKKGRDDTDHLSGEKSKSAKLTKSNVSEIKKLYLTGYYTYKKLGKMFNVHPAHICKILNNKSWISK